MLVLLAGGTGSSKLLRGMDRAYQGSFTVIANTGDDFQHLGLRICPDLDTCLYALAHLQDEERGWGIKGDTFHCLDQLRRYGWEGWFQLGDKDLALHLLRSLWLKEGVGLAEITDRLRSRLGVRHRIMPCTENKLETWVEVEGRGLVHLQEFWVKGKGEGIVKSVKYRGSEDARAYEGALEALRKASAIIVCPANPISSIGPMLALKDFKMALKTSSAKKLAISPIVSASPISGPAAKFMKAMGVEVSPVGVAQFYKGVIDALMIDERDRALAPELEALGIRPVLESIIMKDAQDEERVARRALLEMGL